MKFIVLLILGILLFGCSNQRQLSQFINTKSSNNYDIGIKPLKNNLKSTKYNEIGIIISFLNNDNTQVGEPIYGEYIHFYTFEIGNYIKLIADSDTISCLYFESERNYDISPISHVFAFFPLPDSQRKYSLLILKNDYLNSDHIKFDLSNKFLKLCL